MRLQRGSCWPFWDKRNSIKAALELTEIQLKHSELRAPFNGIIVSRNVEPGEVVSLGREVILLADLSKVDLKVFVAETEIGKVKPGLNETFGFFYSNDRTRLRHAVYSKKIDNSHRKMNRDIFQTRKIF